MKRKSYSLCEFLVALGIVGILVAMLLPAIMKTRSNWQATSHADTYARHFQVVDESDATATVPPNPIPTVQTSYGLDDLLCQVRECRDDLRRMESKLDRLEQMLNSIQKQKTTQPKEQP